MNTQNTQESVAIDRILENHCQQAGALLPILHAIQDAFGHIPDSAVARIAGALNQSCAEIHGVISFYQHFRSEPAARHTVHVCQAEACQARGGRELTAHAERVLGCKLHEHSPDRAFGLEAVHCLGLCASGPAIQLDDRQHARVDPARLDQLLHQAREA
ncbi:formate dehydrogenase subunit gamma [Paludibacterium yongneupense]|uniref:formate dehydrogenase subunit gamma n=1 Tax=Paludibacterium yongneupense TaxID=400061 RepID=UPI0004908F03|nr:formate dehydrogenase subunit gamma [Paludibacterium yongneupense]